MTFELTDRRNSLAECLDQNFKIWIMRNPVHVKERSDLLDKAKMFFWLFFFLQFRDCYLNGAHGKNKKIKKILQQYILSAPISQNTIWYYQ